jgi:recombinational DNA repair protein (RecF pathway)
MVDKIICANCKAFVPRENIKTKNGLPICLTCLEYNNINYDVLQEQQKEQQDFKRVNLDNEALLKCVM